MVNFVAEKRVFSICCSLPAPDGSLPHAASAEPSAPRTGRTKRGKRPLFIYNEFESSSAHGKRKPLPAFGAAGRVFAREMERLRALPPRFVHVESYIEACLTQWETRYPQSAGVDTEARRLGNEVLDQVLRKMNAVAEEARQDFAAAEKDPEECREYYALVEELIDRAGGLAEWEKTDLGTDLVLLYVDKWKALQQEARTALELQDEELEIDEDDAAASRPLRATWQDTLCSFTPFLFSSRWCSSSCASRGRKCLPARRTCGTSGPL